MLEDKYADLIDVPALRAMVDQLSAFDEMRTQAPLPDDIRIPWIEACCLTLIASPLEVGVDCGPSPILRQAQNVLGHTDSHILPEARACWLWLTILEGTPPSDAIQQFMQLAQIMIWQPVWGLVSRALAYYGQEETLAQLAKDSSITFPYGTELRVMAAYKGPLEDPEPDRLDPFSNELHASVMHDWATLLSAEIQMCNKGKSVESQLTYLLHAGRRDGVINYAEAESRRIAVRAAAAITRDRIARHHDARDIIERPICQWMPQWERLFLLGMNQWMLGRTTPAIATLKQALALNIHQSCIRFALAVLLVQEEFPTSLRFIESAGDYCEINVVKATLLIRMGRYEEAEHIMCEVSSRSLSFLPARVSWFGGRRYYSGLLNTLKVTFLERSGNWFQARRRWQKSGNQIPKGLRQTRILMQMSREIKSVGLSRPAYLTDLERRLEQIRYEIGTIPLMGTALYFRACANLEYNSKRAIKDMRTLLARRRWIDAERSVGAQRLVFMGDQLLALGRIDLAKEIYETSRGNVTIDDIDINERLIVATICNCLNDEAGVTKLETLINKCEDVTVLSFWHLVFLAAACMIADLPEKVDIYLRAAEVQGSSREALAVLNMLRTVTFGEADDLSQAVTGLSRCSRQTQVVLGSLLASEEGYPIRSLMESFGKEWPCYCPVDIRTAISGSIAMSCEETAWDRGFALLDNIEMEDQLWLSRLRMLVQIHKALVNAKVDPEAAEAHLMRVLESLERDDGQVF